MDELLPTLYDMVTDGLIEVQDTTVIKSVSKDRPRQTSTAAAARKEMTGPAKLIRIYLGESDKCDGEPLYDAIVKKLRMLDFAGATVYRGILGYGAKKHTHKSGLLHLSHDLPIMISIIDKAERVDELVDAVSPMMQDGLIVISEVEIHRIVHEIPTADEEVTNGSRPIR